MTAEGAIGSANCGIGPTEQMWRDGVRHSRATDQGPPQVAVDTGALCSPTAISSSSIERLTTTALATMEPCGPPTTRATVGGGSSGSSSQSSKQAI